MSFATVKVKHWNEVRPYQKRGWVFRGQSCAEWGLKTSFERCCDREQIPGHERRTFEEKLFRQFRRVYHHYSDHIPSDKDRLEWLSVMQHHGAPTRLLDFTYSVFVATYFALEDAKEDCAVWALNAKWALNESIRLLELAGRQNAALLKALYTEKDMENVPEFFFGTPPCPCASPQNPFRLNERLGIQKGVFLIPGSVDFTFEENLCAMHGHQDIQNIVRLVVPHSDRREALRELFDMNISRTNLFPGLDGYARSLGVYHPDYEPPWSA
jgi:hypothetical protein